MPLVAKAIAGLFAGIGTLYLMFKVFNGYTQGLVVQAQQRGIIQAEADKTANEDDQRAARDAAKAEAERRAGDVTDL